MLYMSVLYTTKERVVCGKHECGKDSEMWHFAEY